MRTVIHTNSEVGRISSMRKSDLQIVANFTKRCVDCDSHKTNLGRNPSLILAQTEATIYSWCLPYNHLVLLLASCC